MFSFRGDKSLPKEKYESATELYADIRSAMKEKADHNKKESQIFFFSVIIFSLAAPIFVTLGENLLWGKIVPATLSVLAAAATSWLQLRKPQRLWAIYRRAQRELEREKTAFDFGIGKYQNKSNSELLLAEMISNIAYNVHEQWEGLVPDVDAISTTVSMEPPRKRGES